MNKPAVGVRRPGPLSQDNLHPTTRITLTGLVSSVILGYVITRPVSSGDVLYPALGVLTLLACISLVRGITPSREYTRLAAAVLLLGVWGTALGVLMGNPGVDQVGLVWLGGAVIWGAWAATFTLDGIRRTFLVVTVASILLSLFILLYVATQIGLVPHVIPDWMLAGQGAGIDSSDGTAVRAYGLSSLVIVTPIMTAAAILGRRDDPYLPPRWLTALAAVLCLGAALLGGRRAIAVVALATPLLIWVVKRVLLGAQRPLHIRPGIWALVPLSAIVLIWGANTPVVMRAEQEAIDAVSAYTGTYIPGAQLSVDDLVRLEQSDELLSSWSQSPVFGHGFGYVLDTGYYRSLLRPWAFELQYQMLLMTTGLVGALALAICLALGVGLLRTAVRRAPQAIPAVVSAAVGAVSLLIANATNPYLQAVGHQWGIAFTLGIANALLRDRPRRVAVQDHARGRTTPAMASGRARRARRPTPRVLTSNVGRPRLG